MSLFCWIVNTAEDSGPTRYMVVASNVMLARIAILASSSLAMHHHAAVRLSGPVVLEPGIVFVV